MTRGGACVRIGVAALVGACHLADDKDPITCGPNEHAVLNRCVLNETALHVIRIASSDGGACAIDPDPLRVKVGEDFQFANDDAIAHVVKGADGQTWATLEAGKSSAFTSISKAGSWAYTVSDCSNGGTVIVE